MLVKVLEERGLDHAFHDLLYYDETSPSGLRWKVNRGGGVKADDVAGWIQAKIGYWYVSVLNKTYLAHRIIVVLHGLCCDNSQVDHIDRNRLNNNIGNLRVVSEVKNRRNTTKSRANKTGVTGVNLQTNVSPSGNICSYYVSRWYDILGKPHRKHFSINKLGQDEAFRIACEHREKIIAELNSQGAGYTSDHGR